ncbi:FUSC family protein [Amycolatopsis sp. WQ 127309]|uniref:FUSC family protein n=1 Tax=Amycolatopsis sp. WQ 127309 TaxID=2932773 RepID=UPI001FF6D82E|nr:FUSC family protein [Amycolatopsis sp. WQ 127309]UOZ03640.1 FUSC family protein [Amycolatopsis sp. WQ 127309]
MGRASTAMHRIRDKARGSDPGLTRLWSAVSAAVAMTTGLAVEYVFATLTGAAPQATLVAVLLGAITAMMGSMALSGTGVWPKVRTAALFPVAMGLGMALGIAVAPHTDLMLAVFVVVMFTAVFVRRFGVPFFFYGFMVWMGYFFAAFLHATLDGLPAMLLAVVIATVWVLLLSLTVLRGNPSRTLARTRRAFGARARTVVRLCATLLEDGPDERLTRRIHAAQARLAESALMIEAWSAEVPVLPGAVPAASIRRTTMDAQLAIDLLVTACAQLGPGDAPDLVTRAAHLLDLFARNDYATAGRTAEALLAQAGGSPVRLVAVAVTDYLDVVRRAGQDGFAGTGDFEPAVSIALGALPGSAAAAGDVEPRGGAWNPLRRLDFTTRQAVQVAVAGGLAIVLGRLLSEQRYYWAVIAAFVAFTGTATRSEVFLKSVNRVAGTLVGLGAGIGLAHLTAGHPAAVLAVIVGSMFCGFYLQRLSYAYMIFFVTIMVSQLYSVLNEFSTGLLVLRLEETAIGAAVGVGVGLVLTPLSTRDTVRTTHRALARTLSELLTAAADRIEGHAGVLDLDARVRVLDNDLRQLRLVAAPLVAAVPWGGGSRTTRHRLTLAATLVQHTHRLVAVLRRGRAGDRSLAAPARALADVATAVADPGDADLTALLGLVEAALAQHCSPADEPVLVELIHLRRLLHEIATGDEPGLLPEPAVPGTGAITGRVHDAAGAPLAEATLTLVDAHGRQTARATSAADGGFTLQAPRAGSYVLITAAGRHRPAATTVLARHGREVVQDIWLTAARPQTAPARRPCHRHDVRLH